MSSPKNYISINMEECRPLLEAEVMMSLILFVCLFVLTLSVVCPLVSLSCLSSASVQKMQSFNASVKLYYSGLQFMYSMSAAVNKMASPTLSHFVCMTTYFNKLWPSHSWAPMTLNGWDHCNDQRCVRLCSYLIKMTEIMFSKSKCHKFPFPDRSMTLEWLKIKLQATVT